MHARKVHARRATDHLSEFHSDVFEGWIRGSLARRAWQVLKVLFLSSPIGLALVVPSVEQHKSKYLKVVSAETDREAYAHLTFFTIVPTLLFIPTLFYMDAARSLLAIFIYVTVLVGLMTLRRNRFCVLAYGLLGASIALPVVTLVLLTKFDACGGVLKGFGFELLCHYQEHHAFPSAWVNYFYVVHFGIVITHKVPYRVHIAVLLLTVILNLWTAALCVGIDRFGWPDVKLAYYHAATLLMIVWMHEREARYHFLATVETDRMAKQERMLVSLLGHEIKSPLTFVSFFLRGLAERERKGHESLAASTTVAALLPDALTSTSILVDIVANCRRLAAFESGTYEQQDDALNLHDLANSCFAMHGRERETGLQLELQCPTDLTVVSDRRLWQHALMNLIGNAVKFTVHGKPKCVASPCVKVHIGVVGDGRVRVEVIDNGPGIAASDQQFIFGKYAQATANNAGEGFGTGLGLHLTAKIIRMLRGELVLVSPLRNERGASFSFSVPCVFASREVHMASPNVRELQADEGPRSGAPDVPAELRVLLVEDDDLNVLVMKTSLQAGMKSEFGTDVHVTRARTAEAALQLIGDGACAFDLLVVDQHMEPAGGTMKGSQLVEILSARPCAPGSQGPLFCIASGNADSPADVAMFCGAGASIVWAKPYPTGSVLARDIVSAMQQRQVPAVERSESMQPSSACREIGSTARGSSLRGVAAKISKLFCRLSAKQLPVAVAFRCVCTRIKDSETGIVGWRLFDPPFMPVVDAKMFERTRSAIIASRDKTLVRFASFVYLLFYNLSNAADPMTDTSTAIMLLCFITAAHAYICWSPTRWPILAWGIILLNLLVCLQVMYLNAKGVCDDPHHSAHSSSDTSFCETQVRAGILDTNAVMLFYSINTWVVFLGVIPFRVHAVAMLVQMVALVTAAITVGPKEGPLYKPQVVLIFGQCINTFVIMFALCRKFRMHFVENHEKLRLVEQQRTLVSLLCHEIKSPLNVINFFMNGLKVPNETQAKREHAAPSDGAQDKDVIVSDMLPDALRALSVIVDIVANCRRLAKFESGTYEQQDDTLNLHDLASSCLAMHAREREAGLQMELHCPADLTVISDRQLWQHALMNMVGNAVKFTTQERRAISGAPCVKVKIGVVSDGRVRVEVIDNGPGIVAGDQEFGFGRDLQHGRGFHSQGLGSGLGLHLSSQIIRMLRGKVEVVTPLRDGWGTSFSFSIPCKFATPTRMFSRKELGKAKVVPMRPSGNIQTWSDSSSGGTSEPQSSDCGSTVNAVAVVPAELRVLLVEDDDLNVLVMKTSLQAGMKSVFGTDVHVTRARTAEAALQLIGDGACAFDLLVVDQHMEPAGGTMKGSQLVEILSARPCAPGSQGPLFCIASGNADDDAQVASFKADGADIIWPKPYPATERIASDIAQAFSARE